MHRFTLKTGAPAQPQFQQVVRRFALLESCCIAQFLIDRVKNATLKKHIYENRSLTDACAHGGTCMKRRGTKLWTAPVMKRFRRLTHVLNASKCHAPM